VWSPLGLDLVLVVNLVEEDNKVVTEASSAITFMVAKYVPTCLKQKHARHINVLWIAPCLLLALGCHAQNHAALVRKSVVGV
jgi:hypothetical protein